MEILKIWIVKCVDSYKIANARYSLSKITASFTFWRILTKIHIPGEEVQGIYDNRNNTKKVTEANTGERIKFELA